MTIEAITWALAQQVERSSAKFVLVAMANCANHDMTCWPSTAYLSAATCQDRKTVLENIKRLKEAGFISDLGERKGQTGQIVVYKLDSPENGTVKESRKRNSPENGCKESRFSAQRVPFFRGNSTENGTRNRQGTIKGTVREPKEKVRAAERRDRKSTRLNSSHLKLSRMPSSA